MSLKRRVRYINPLEIEISDIWRVICQRIVLISVITGVTVITTGFVSFYMITPKYEALTSVIVKEQSSDNVIVYDDLIASEKLLKTYSEILKSNSVAEEVITNLKLTVTPESLLNQLKVQGSNESLITSIIIVDEDPAKAVAISNEFARTSLEKWRTVMNMDNVFILDEAKLADKPLPVQPKPFLYMIVSFFVALIIGISVAILIEFLDRTLKTEDQIEQILKLPVLGVIPLAHSKRKKEQNFGGTEGGMKMHERQN